MTVQEIREKAVESLRNSQLRDFPEQIRTASLDTDILISQILQKDRTWILFHRTTPVSKDDEEKIFSAIEKRKSGLPIAYITGHKEFFALDFLVTPKVLIPKPDTELLVEQVLSEIERRNSPVSLCDMCAGSGCVGISVLKNAGSSVSSAVFADISVDALEICRKNAARILGNERKKPEISFVPTNLFSDVVAGFDVIATNPPYVPSSVARALLEDGRSEPILALDGDVDENGESSGTDDGLSLISRLVPESYDHLFHGGALLMETGEYNAQETAALFEKAGFSCVRIENDMNGMMRNVIGFKK